VTVAAGPAHPRLRRVHQVVPVLLHADAIGDETRAIRDGLRARGIASDVFALPQARAAANLDASALPLNALLAGPAPDAVLYHFAVSSPASAALAASGLPVVLIHHNVTPPHWFHMVDPEHEVALAAAEEELPGLRSRVALALGDSEYTRRELDAMGFAPTGVLPILLDQAPYREHRPGPLHQEIGAAPTLLTVGRVAPNKRIEDCIRLLAAYRAGVDPRARLWIAGDDGRLPVYRDALARLVDRLRLGDAVRFLGRVTQQELIDCYRGATAYVSMSEHEGFGVPLLEAMVCDLPVLAHAATAVPFTLGDAGLQMRDKDFPLLAEALGALLGDALALRDQRERGRRRAAELAPERTLDHLVALLDSVAVRSADARLRPHESLPQR
jgi:glycosyltransferase involved in cell wall biosynthesis